jgi:hypothetical protein
VGREGGRQVHTIVRQRARRRLVRRSVPLTSTMPDPYAPPSARIADIGPGPSRTRSALVLTRVVAVAGCVILCAIPLLNAFSAHHFSLPLTVLTVGFGVLSLATLLPLFSASGGRVLVWFAILLNVTLLALGSFGMVAISPRQAFAFYGMLVFILPAAVNLFALLLVLVLRGAFRVHGQQA